MTFSEEEKKRNDAFFMKRCIQLAENGLHTTSPNPMVGSVIVYGEKVIGEGYHIRPGEGHAEVNAIRSVADENLLQKSTLYVNLEPCSHQGRTPSCADLIIEKGIKRVVIGCKDPFIRVNGNGIHKLQEAGIETTVGILEKECIALNRRFMTFHSKKRPYIVLKWAESADGFMDKKRESGIPQIFSSAHTTMCAHKLRAENESILIGRRTALLDNPSLTVRNWIGKNPIRLLIDRQNASARSLNLFDRNAQTFVFSDKSHFSPASPDPVTIDFSKNRIPEEILQNLYLNGIQSLLIEGGNQTLHAFIEADLWDEAYIEKSSVLLNEGVPAPKLGGIEINYVRFNQSFVLHRNPKGIGTNL